MTKRAPEANVIGAKLAQLATKIADEANAPGVALTERIECFKVLTTFYVNTTKVAAKLPSDDDGESNFSDYRKRIAATTGGTGQGTA